MKTLKGMVSVIIPVYNRSHIVMNTIYSVLTQTYTNLQVIIIDDGSEDNLGQKLEPLIQAQKIDYFRQDNSGISVARNKGIQLAKGEFISFLDSDDLLNPKKIQKQIDIFRKNKNISVVNCDFNKFDTEYNNLGRRNLSFYHGNIYPMILSMWSMLLATPCLMFRKSVFNNIGNFDVGIKSAEDLDMWARVSMEYDFFHISESLVKIRLHEESMSRSERYPADNFIIMLNKAFERDPKLSISEKNIALKNMYKYTGLNLLSRPNKDKIILARQYLSQSLRYNRYDLILWGGYLVSFLGISIRRRLFLFWNKITYKKA